MARRKPEIKYPQSITMKRNAVLVYIERDGKYLMLRTKYKNYETEPDRWYSIANDKDRHICAVEEMHRIVREQTGVTLTKWRYRGVIELYYDTRKEPCDHYERLHLFTATEWEGEITMDGPDGQLAWVEKERVAELNLWHGCRVALRVLEQDLRFFHLMLCYKPGWILCDAALNQKRVPLEAWIT